MSKLTGTVKIYGTKLYSGCGHVAVKYFDTCPRCRIEYLEGVCESQQASNESLAKIIEGLEAKLKETNDE